MKVGLLGLVALTLAALAVPLGAAAQGKDTLTIALPSHAPTLDPHMHFERVGVLVNINMFGLAPAPLRQARVRALAGSLLEGAQRHDVGIQAPPRRQVPRRLDHDGRGREVLVRSSAGARQGKEEVAPVRQRARDSREVKIVDAGHDPADHRQAVPAPARAPGVLRIVPKKHVEKVGEEAFGSTATVGTGPGSSSSGSATSTSGSRPSTSTAREAGLQVRRLPGDPRVATAVAELRPGAWTSSATSMRTSCPTSRLIRKRESARRRSSACTTSPSTLRSAPFEKKAGRQAANYAIDKQAVVEKMMAGLGRQVATVVQPAAFGFRSLRDAVPARSEESQGAAGAGRLPNGFDITLHSSAVDWRPHFEALGQMLTEVGLRTTVKMWDPGPAWNNSSRLKARPPRPVRQLGETIRSSTPTPCCTRSITRSPVAGSANLRARRRARPAHR